MARRPIEKELYDRLNESNLNFIPRGIIHIHDIYDFAAYEFPNLCDDQYFCSQHCRSGKNQSEWKHVVRSLLNYMQAQGRPVIHTGNIGFWEFQ